MKRKEKSPTLPLWKGEIPWSAILSKLQEKLKFTTEEQRTEFEVELKKIYAINQGSAMHVILCLDQILYERRLQRLYNEKNIKMLEAGICSATQLLSILNSDHILYGNTVECYFTYNAVPTLPDKSQVAAYCKAIKEVPSFLNEHIISLKSLRRGNQGGKSKTPASKYANAAYEGMYDSLRRLYKTDIEAMKTISRLCFYLGITTEKEEIEREFPDINRILGRVRKFKADRQKTFKAVLKELRKKRR